jgi:hypothetical protein
MNDLARRVDLTPGQVYTLAISAGLLLVTVVFGAVPASQGIDPARLGLSESTVAE